MTLDAIARGTELFNRGAYWEAHEAWEEIWLGASGDFRIMLQAMIQFAAALHHVRRGNRKGAVRLLAASKEKASRSNVQLVALAELRSEIARCEGMVLGEIGLDRLRTLLAEDPPKLRIPG